jgi:hypothetical protein
MCYTIIEDKHREEITMKDFFARYNIKGMALLGFFLYAVLYVAMIIILVYYLMFPSVTQEKGEKEFIQQSANDCYALTCKVVKIDRNKDIVTMEDSTGHHWKFYGVEDWEINDCVSAIMNDCGTTSILDDEIMSVRYSGWVIE